MNESKTDKQYDVYSLNKIEIICTALYAMMFIGATFCIVNYGIIGLIQLRLGYAESEDLSFDKAVEYYDQYVSETRDLMIAKNHDYDEAWRSMRVNSYTDLILMKIMRTKQIEDNNGVTQVSEGIDANYMDMINYSVFAIIKLTEE